MKNKKIILGLGTITALGAMSVGFIACVKEKEVKKIVDEAGYSKLTEDQVKKIVDEAGYSKLTEDQVKKIVGEAGYSKLTKDQIINLLKDLPGSKHDFEFNFSEQVKHWLAQPKNKKDITTNSDIGHFVSGSKVKDVIDHINKAIQDKGWSVVEVPQRDNIVGSQTKEVLEKNGKVLEDGVKSLSFRLKTGYKTGEMSETNESLFFNFFVGQKDLSTITDEKIHHSAITKEKIVAELNKKEEFKNIDLSVEDFEDIAKDDLTKPKKDVVGKVKIKAKGDSKKVKGEIELTLETVKQELKETHLTGFVATNNTTAKDVKDYINTQSGFKEKGNDISEADFDFAIDKATLNHIGKIKITPTGKTEGESFTIDIPKLKDLKTVITNPDLGELANNKEATIKAKIKEKFDSIKDDGHLEITSITSTTAKVKGKGIYAGEVDVTFKTATTTSN